MFSLRDLRLVLCSRDLDVLRAQRIVGFLILITHKSTRSENPITWPKQTWYGTILWCAAPNRLVSSPAQR